MAFKKSRICGLHQRQFMGKITPQILVTFINIRKTKGNTIHQQLYEQLKKAIHEGMLTPGERLPSSRELSAELKISRNAVLQVFEQLIMEGFFEGKTGSGTFVGKSVAGFSRSKSRRAGPNADTTPIIRQFNHAGLNNAFRHSNNATEPMLPFQQSVPLISEFPFAAWGRVGAAVHRKMHLLHLAYDDVQGYFPLRKAIADHLRISRSIKCDPGQILIVNGTRQALHLAAEMLINKGDQCWIEDPGYPGAVSAVERFGGQVCPIPVISTGADIDFAIAHYPKAKLAYVTPSHQFPMGNTMALSERIKLLNWAQEHQMWIIEDDYDSEFRYDGRPIPALQGMDKHGSVIYSGTFSKVLLPAIRLGYLVFPSEAMARRFANGKSIIDGQCNVVTQAIVSDFITQGHFSRHIRRMKLLYKKNQDELVALIKRHLKDQLVPVPVEAGMHFIAWLPEGLDAGIIANEALQQNVIVHPVSQYSISTIQRNGLLLGFAGFSFKEMETAVLILKNVLDNHK